MCTGHKSFRWNACLPIDALAVGERPGSPAAAQTAWPFGLIWIWLMTELWGWASA
jgi:hypothetical protein